MTATAAPATTASTKAVVRRQRHRYVIIEIHKLDQTDLARGAAVMGVSSLISRGSPECLDCGLSWYENSETPDCPGAPEGTEDIAPDWRP